MLCQLSDLAIFTAYNGQSLQQNSNWVEFRIHRKKVYWKFVLIRWTLDGLIAGDGFEPPFSWIWAMRDSASLSCRNRNNRVSNRFIVLCFPLSTSFSAVDSLDIFMRLWTVSLENSFINVRCVNIFNSEIYQPGNQIHLGYAVSHLNLPNPHAQLEVFFHPYYGWMAFRRNGSSGFEPRTYGLWGRLLLPLN